MTGLFFCLASAEGAGLLFCPAVIQPHKSVYSVFCAVHAVYTARATKQRTELYRGFTRDYARSTAHDIRPTQADIIPPAQCWSVSQRPDGLHRYQILPPLRTLHSSAQPPHYNNVYKGTPLLWIHARQCSRSQTMPARRGLDTSHARRLAIWHRSAVRTHRLEPYTQQDSPAAGRGGRRGTIDGCRRISFRAFAR